MDAETGATAKELRAQTEKWLAKLEAELPKARLTGFLPAKEGRELLENARAYVKDCKHFVSKGDWVNAFEAVIYAWGIYETALRVGALRA
ncbi:MAG TPA: DUF357 domain-containing protein [archaeon]|nr:DUF357 domain-containing protein [archaeon]